MKYWCFQSIFLSILGYWCFWSICWSIFESWCFRSICWSIFWIVGAFEQYFLSKSKILTVGQYSEHWSIYRLVNIEIFMFLINMKSISLFLQLSLKQSASFSGRRLRLFYFYYFEVAKLQNFKIPEFQKVVPMASDIFTISMFSGSHIFQVSNDDSTLSRIRWNILVIIRRYTGP